MPQTSVMDSHLGGDAEPSEFGHGAQPSEPDEGAELSVSIAPIADVPKTADRPVLAEPMAAALAAFDRHLALERGLSTHTVRAYTGDIASLLGYAADDYCDDPADIDIGILRGWLANMHKGWPGANDDRPAGSIGPGVHGFRAPARLAGRRSRRPAAHAQGAPASAGSSRAGADDSGSRRDCWWGGCASARVVGQRGSCGGG